MKGRDRYWQLLDYIRPHGRTIIQALLCTLVFTSIWPVLAWIAGQMAAFIGQGKILAIAQLAGISTIVFFGAEACPVRSGLADGKGSASNYP
ncbi:MAG: hypothetical protein RBJ76_17845 [Stenomitos frigidus ULC029]